MHAFLLHVKCVCYTLKHAKRYLADLPAGADQYFSGKFRSLLDQALTNAQTVGFDLAWHNRALHVDMADDCARVTLLLSTTGATTNDITRQFVAEQTRLVKQACLYTSLVGPNMFVQAGLAEPVYLAFCGVVIEPCSWHDASCMFGRDKTVKLPQDDVLKTNFPANWHSKLDEIVRYKPYCALFSDQLVKHIRFIKTTRY